MIRFYLLLDEICNLDEVEFTLVNRNELIWKLKNFLV